MRSLEASADGTSIYSSPLNARPQEHRRHERGQFFLRGELRGADGVKDTWREVAKHAADQLIARFGKSVRMHYFDLFDSDYPPLPDQAQLPLLLIEGEVLSSGWKISVPAIRKRLEALDAARHYH